MISQYLIKFNNIQFLELLDCNIDYLGCEHLAKAFEPKKGGGNLQVIKLDHNPIGSDGALILAQSLGKNPDVQLLSLTYCQIEADGADGLFEIIIYQNSKILELALTGNPLGNEGIIKVFSGLSCAKSI